MERLDSRTVYANAWMTVREDRIRWPDGSTGIYGVVEKPDFALVLPRWAEGFWMVEQFRYPVGRRAWEFPQGSWGRGDGGSAAALARQELAEETGLRAETVTHLGHLFEAYGFSTQGFDGLPGHGAGRGGAGAGGDRAGHGAPAVYRRGDPGHGAGRLDR